MHRRQGERAACPARHQAHLSGHDRDLHFEGGRSRSVEGLAELCGLLSCSKQDPAVVQP